LFAAYPVARTADGFTPAHYMVEVAAVAFEDMQRHLRGEAYAVSACSPEPLEG